MPKKRIKSSKKGLYFVFLLVLCLSVASLLIGNFFRTFLLILIVITTLSLIYSIIKIKSFGKELLNETIEIACAIALALLTALVIATVLPYVLLHEFVSIYLVLYVYMICIFIFFTAIGIFSAIIRSAKIIPAPAFKAPIISTAAVSLVVTVLLMIGTNYLYKTQTERYNLGIDKLISGLSLNNRLYKDYPVYAEIRAYQDQTTTDARRQQEAFKNADTKSLYCFKTTCLRSASDKAYELTNIVVRSYLVNGALTSANKELEKLQAGIYKQNFSSLEEYEAYLRDDIDSSGFSVSGLTKSDADNFALVETDFTYQDLEKIDESNSSASGLPNIWGFDTYGHSVFFNSFSYAIRHTTAFREVFRLSARIKIYTTQASKNNDIIVEMFKNMDINEPTESKIIRYKLILYIVQRNHPI